jgi:hypothetical protein
MPRDTRSRLDRDGPRRLDIMAPLPLSSAYRLSTTAGRP